MKKIQFLTYLIPLIILYNNLAHSHNPDTIWTKIHSISPQGDIDEGICVRQTSDGGFIITGSCVPDGLESDIDFLSLKTDASGNIAWLKSYGKDFVESAFSVEQTSDGGYIIGGRAVTGSYPLVEPPISDVWILKTDVNGDTLWTKTYGFLPYGSIDYTPDDGCIISLYGGWLIKTDASGDSLWSKNYSRYNLDETNDVRLTHDGGYMGAGGQVLRQGADGSESTGL